MASFARNAAAFAATLWPIILFYAAFALIVVFGVLRHPLQDFPQHPAPVRVEQSPDSVPNAISCQFRGEGFCHPKRFDV